MFFKNKFIHYPPPRKVRATRLGAESQQKSKQSGRSMIEMLGVLAIVGILSAGGIAGYSMAMQNHKTNVLIERVQLIAQRTRELYSGDYSTLGGSGSEINKLINAGLITDKTNPFGGDLEMGRSATDNTNKSVFYIRTGDSQASVKNIPPEACVKILTTDWGDKGVFTSFLIDMSVTVRPPVSVERAVSVCKNDSHISWRFK